MIPELDRFHGVVLRQLLVGCGRRVTVGAIDPAGRVDSFAFERAAFQVKYSSKRLSPWRFTIPREHFVELRALRMAFDPVWIFLVCGTDGVVGISLEELEEIGLLPDAAASWVSVSRDRNAMYRVAGPLGKLGYAKRRGVHDFLEKVLTD